MFESWQVLLGEAHSLWQDNTETIEESGLRRVWLGHAAQANLAMRCGRQDDVLGLNALELLQDSARGSADRHRITVSPVSEWRVSLTSTPSWTMRQPSERASSKANFFSSDFGAPMM